MLRYQLCLFLLFKSVISIDNNKSAINNVSDSSNTVIAEGINIPVNELLHNKEHQTARHANPNVVARKGVNLPDLPLLHATSESSLPIESVEIHPKVLDNSSKTPSQQSTSPTTKASNATKVRFHLKPTATVIDTNAEQKKNHHPSDPTRTPPLGMPSKMTYVAPVILTILILPLFILSMVYIYKHGRDCWSKRHYRRMDFLIDGMYNE